ncbi:MAG TPA: Calx-beta domain-containing protein [Deltaproteobacteria bacterium]|nr:Calx-beta domain-containing protein [Deltaproteobacteria bacterium]
MTLRTKAGIAGILSAVMVLGLGVVMPAYSVSNDDRDALIELYLATQGDNWDDNSGWREEPLSSDGFGRRSTVCSWYGIICDWLNLSLLQIDLAQNNLDGYLTPLNELPRHALEELTTLDLSDNHLKGSIPRGLEDLDELTSLILHDNNLSGTIPTGLGSLDLEYMNLRGNMLAGPVPSELQDLEDLGDGSLDLRWNALYTSDGGLKAFLDSRQIGGDWESTQTIAPTDIRVGRSTLSSIEVIWDAIDYIEDEGAYEVYVSTVSGGPYTLAATAADKMRVSVEVTGLLPGTTYYLRMRSVTYAHLFNKNDVYSDFTHEISAATLGGDLPGISIGDISVEEQNKAAVFTVVMDTVSNLDVSFFYATSGGTAENDGDYLHTEGTGIIEAGQQSASLEVPVVDDDEPEEEETFYMVLSEPVNASLVVASGEARIVDDENPVVPEGSAPSEDKDPDNVCFISSAAR